MEPTLDHHSNPAMSAQRTRTRHRSSSGSANSRRNSASLINILEDAVKANSLLKSEALRSYMGCSNFSALQAGGGFLPMNGNRAIDRSVVASRVADNLRRLREGLPLADFGMVILVVVSDGPPDWLVMDGQHRLEAMRELHASHGVDVHFEFKAKVVRNEAEAHEALMLYQDQHPPDPRTFFPDRRQTGLAEQVLARLREEFPARELWPASDRSSSPHGGGFRQQRPGLRVGDVSRPLLSNSIAMGMLGSTGLLRDEAATVAGVTRHLLAANEVLKGRGTAALGPGVTDRMRERAASLGCFLGFLREAKLEYASIRDEVDAHLHLQARTALATPPGHRERGSGSDEDGCHNCFSAPRTHVFLPCGHKYACGLCATGIAGGRRPLCPTCREVITGTLRVYD